LANQVTDAEAAESAWKGLYKVGGAAALTVIMLEVGEITLGIFYPQPTTVTGWFTLFQSNAIIGLLDFWGWEVPMYVRFAMVFLAVYFVLRKVDEGRMAIATTLALLGVGVFLATTNPFSMLSVSNQYAGATTDAQSLYSWRRGRHSLPTRTSVPWAVSTWVSSWCPLQA